MVRNFNSAFYVPPSTDTNQSQNATRQETDTGAETPREAAQPGNGAEAQIEGEGMRTTQPPLKNPSQFDLQQPQHQQQHLQADPLNKTRSGLTNTTGPSLSLYGLLTSTQKPVNSTGVTATTIPASANNNKAFTTISPTPSSTNTTDKTTRIFTRKDTTDKLTDTNKTTDKNSDGKDFKNGLKKKHNRNHGKKEALNSTTVCRVYPLNPPVVATNLLHIVNCCSTFQPNHECFLNCLTHSYCLLLGNCKKWTSCEVDNKIG